MKFITSNEFAVRDTFCFGKEIVEQYSSFVMGSLDVNSLFTNTPLDEFVDTCTNSIYSEIDLIEGINKEEFRNLF